MANNSFAGYDADEEPYIPLEATESIFDRLRVEILDRISHGLSAVPQVTESNPFILGDISNNPFIIPMNPPTHSFKNVKPPTEAEAIENKTTQVIKVPRGLRSAFIEKLDENIEKMRTFLTLDIAPVVIGFDTACDESVQILRLITHDDALSLNTRRVQEMFKELMTIKLSKYLSEVLEIDSTTYNKVLDAYLAKYMSPAPKQPTSNNVLSKILAEMPQKPSTPDLKVHSDKV